MNFKQEIKNNLGMGPELLTLEPKDALTFHGPFNRSVCEKLVITNPSKTAMVVFKMKTTSPRQFFVRPNIGLLGPNGSVSVDIFMQPTMVEPGLKPHKFMILAATATSDVVDVTEFWKNQKPENIWDTKIKCELVPGKNDDQYRQAGGGMSASPRSDVEAEYDALEVSEPVAKLLKQVNALEDERMTLEAEIKVMREGSIGGDPDQQMVRQSHWGRRGVYTFVAFVFTVLAAIVGAFYGKHYL
ncbi:vesicle-associated membrane protein-associated protein B [Drosophila bipectinata]|uniref:vesicle-associated membrane protein-associated protein B n=1 Tax=Drosophila bipectinata TaxID=42026 RepID=UPI0007E5FFEE|nr:vesicle-associated membrane protein-associated protein B [Drosophila bipectinata]KAH8256216.1 hypothetical protein KR026_010961 [Drosophila bipectinata]